jgi:hypothetical protein
MQVKMRHFTQFVLNDAKICSVYAWLLMRIGLMIGLNVGDLEISVGALNRVVL